MGYIADKKNIEREKRIKEVTKSAYKNRVLLKKQSFRRHMIFEIMDHYKISQRKASEYLRIAMWKIKNGRTTQ